jgi:long-chain acyl-CoA synthetase
MLATVGPPLPVIDVRLESVPEMGYNAFGNPPCGEVCIRGETVFSGYYKRQDLTNEVLIDGWFHSGNVLINYTKYGASQCLYGLVLMLAYFVIFR